MGKQYAVVGGTRGIGAAVVEGLLGRGHRVLQLSRDPGKAVDHPAMTSVAWDASSSPFPSESLPAAIDGLVYCPGSIRLRPFERISDRDWREDIELNLLGAVRALQGALKSLRQAPSGSVVLFSSVAVGTGLPFHASVASAKGAVEGMTRALAAELAPQIRVNAVAPTLTDTPLAERLLGNAERRAAAAERHPLKRVADPAVVAAAVLWLLEDATMTTGQVIPVDGGLGSLRTGA
jgi:NAD(P)-dependent dehydrogenase (short-subunit alcohol dehydrogenase family)